MSNGDTIGCWEKAYYYDEKQNLLTDEEGEEIVDIFSIISPNSLYLFKAKKKDMLVYGVTGNLVGLIYPD
ncbi:MAG: hypothetical protein K0S61_159 [Anaerocolumna sp.]|jgi:hypothetical protein|nr:hypothetical protein [Anaerocolumna sp.]